MICQNPSVSFGATHLKQYIKEGRLETQQSIDEKLSDQLFELGNLFYLFSNPAQLKQDCFQISEQNKTLGEVEDNINKGARSTLICNNEGRTSRIDIQGDKIVLSELLTDPNRDNESVVVSSTTTYSPEDFSPTKLKSTSLSPEQLQEREKKYDEKINDLYNKVVNHFKNLYMYHVKAQLTQNVTREDKSKFIKGYNEIATIFNHFEGMMK